MVTQLHHQSSQQWRHTQTAPLIFRVFGSPVNPVRFTLIGTAKLNNIDPQAWLADVIGRINDMPVSRLHELLPWNWKTAEKWKAPSTLHSRGTYRIPTFGVSSV
jgi:hypothetical protein